MRLVRVSLPEDASKRYSYFRRFLKTINGSWIQTYKYCPYQLYLERVKKVEVPPTRSMREGTAAHMVLEEEHKKMVERELSIEDALSLAPFENESYAYREVKYITQFDNFQLISKVDEIVIGPDKVVIIDDKRSRKVYDGQIFQVYAYAYAFKHMFDVDRDIRVQIRSHVNSKLLYDHEFGGEEERAIEKTLGDVLRLLKNEFVPQVEYRSSKCDRCRFRDYCEVYLKHMGKW